MQSITISGGSHEKLSQAGELDDDKILEIISEKKANQKEWIKIPTARVRKLFPENYSTSQIEEAIIKMVKFNINADNDNSLKGKVNLYDEENNFEAHTDYID